MAKNSTMVMMNAAVSSSGLRPSTWPSSTLVTGTGSTMASSSSGSIPAASARSRTATSWMAPVTTALQLLVGALAPFELLGVHHEHVDVTVAYGGFAVGRRVVVVDADRRVDGVALRLHGVR